MGGPAISASLTTAHSVGCQPDGRIYIGDMTGRIRVVDPGTGIIQTFAGTGQAGYSGDGGPATEARIGGPSSIAFDRGGNLYFTDLTQHVVRMVDAAGTITTVAGTGEPGYSPDGHTGPRSKAVQAPGSRGYTGGDSLLLRLAQQSRAGPLPQTARCRPLPAAVLQGMAARRQRPGSTSPTAWPSTVTMSS